MSAKLSRTVSKAFIGAGSLLFALFLFLLLVVPTAASEAASDSLCTRVTFSVKPSVRLLPEGGILSNVPAGILRHGNMLTAFPL